MTKKLIQLKISDILPYENNPRKNDAAVEAVMESIKQCSYIAPIIVDENYEILAGHTRCKALYALGKDECDVLVVEGLTDEQKRKYRLLDNKTNEFAEWDYDLLGVELEGLDFGSFDFEWDIASELDEDDETDDGDEKYTMVTDIPQYTPHSDVQDISICYDREKQKQLEKEIDDADLPDDIRQFLKIASYRHVRFDYRKIADFYSTAGEDIQELFEHSALVLIDFDDAIKNGYAKLKAELEASI